MSKALLTAAENNDVDKLKQILEQNKGNKKFNINYTDSEKNTALFIASEKGNYNAAEFLVNNGAKIDLKTGERSQTALQVACRHGHTRIAELLVKNNADINIQGKNTRDPVEASWSPLQEACYNGHYDTAKMLIKHGVKIDQQHEVLGNALMLTGHSRHSNIAELLLASGANVDIKDISGDTAFHHACSFGDIRTIKAHLNSDINIDIRGAGGKTPLMKVVSQYGNIKGTGGIEAIDLLLSKNADINAQDNYGNTTLMHLCSSDRQSKYPKIQLEIALHLLERGADFSLQNKNGETAKDVAIEHKLVPTIALLEKLEIQAYLNSLQVPEEIETALVAEIDEDEPQAEPTGPAKTYADRSAHELKKLKARDVERDSDSELSMGL